MNRIVREHYPVEKLPEDLREGLPEGATVTVTVEEVATKPSLEELKALVKDILENPKPMTIEEARALVGPRNVTAEEAVQRIRALRDEWD
ncbi:hypothetical protein [Xanthobacter autotrophicus]|uniref:hypothetical protein n=1 Tax=Xanthobacter autotrophicus TaxID=280 RepID=UPI0024A7898F|nr:hypothetical protein [Xanthobacter autotrophicus]MDI4656413.1 hypothetical protein [Xanthobacter autotrophicus]